jgi:hypothetical protein
MAKSKRESGSRFTEDDWLECLALLAFYGLGHGMQTLVLDGEVGITDRKVQLYCVACARRVLHLVPNKLVNRAVELAEQQVDAPTGTMTTAARSVHAEIVAELDQYGPAPDYLPRPPLDPLTEAAYELAADLAEPEQIGARVRYMGGQAAALVALAAGDPNTNPEAAFQVAFHRDIFGNMFRKAELAPVWRTDTVIALAQGMYESRDFRAMPILADALQDAGCDDNDILNHCRDANQVHVRGCWVVDLVLGKR